MRPLRVIATLLLLISGLSLITMVTIPPDHASYSGQSLRSVAILKPGINNVIWSVGAGCAAALLLASAICWQAGLRRHYAICLAIGLLGFPLAAVQRLKHSLAPWTTYGNCRGPDGETYVFMDSSFLQGQTLALGRVAAEGLLYRNFVVLGDTNGDDPRSYAVLVRPKDRVGTAYGQLHLCENHLLVGLRHDNRCYFAYDFATNQFIGHGDIEGISPFLLIDERSELYGPDVEALLSATRAKTKGAPSREAILNATQHPNEEVRQLAAELLERDEP